MKENDSRLMSLLLDMANDITGKLKSKSCVEGIVYLGGIARGSVDVFSDLDIAVFCHMPCEVLKIGEQLYHGTDLDVMLFDFDYSRTAKWSHAQRQAFGEGKLMYDRRGEVDAMLRSKLTYTAEERLLDLLNIIMNLNWRGFRGRSVVLPKDYSSNVPYDLMARRGCMACSHAGIN